MKPVLLVVSEDERVRTELRHDLDRRLSTDYAVLDTSSVPGASGTLDECAARGQQVALVFADQRLGTGANDVFAAARASHPQCLRILIIARGNLSPQSSIIDAFSMGQVDFHLFNPWHPLERNLYPAVSDFLSAWSKSQETPVVAIRLCGAQNSPRTHELRDLLTRAAIPFRFYNHGTVEGQAFLEEVGAVSSSLPLVAFYTGLVLEDPSNADIVSALGMNDSASG